MAYTPRAFDYSFMTEETSGSDSDHGTAELDQLNELILLIDEYRARTYAGEYATRQGVEPMKSQMSDALYDEAIERVDTYEEKDVQTSGQIIAVDSVVTYFEPDDWATVKVCYDYSEQTVYSADAPDIDFYPYRKDRGVEVFQALRTEGRWALTRQYAEQYLTCNEIEKNS